MLSRCVHQAEFSLSHSVPFLGDLGVYVKHLTGPMGTIEHTLANISLPPDTLGFCILPSHGLSLCVYTLCGSVCVCVSILYLNTLKEDEVVSGNLYPQSKTLSLGRALISHRPLVSVLWTSWPGTQFSLEGQIHRTFFGGGGRFPFYFLCLPF